MSDRINADSGALFPMVDTASEESSADVKETGDYHHLLIVGMTEPQSV